MNTKKYKLFFFLILFPFLASTQTHILKDIPSGFSPTKIGAKLSHNFVSGGHMLWKDKWIHYAEVCTWYGALKYAEGAKDFELLKLLQDKFEPFFTTENYLLPGMDHVDLNMFGSLPLELYQITKDKKYLELGLPYADSQWEVPDDSEVEKRRWAEKGFSWQTRLWIDDMYMITIIQSQAYKVTGNKKYINRAAKEMVLYLKELQRPNGLFYHAPDVPFYWARGNGWMAAGMTELLRYLPKNHVDYDFILKSYQTMMNSLKHYQGKDGLWNQLIDEHDFWVETSGSAMFTYAFITGIKHGWLKAEEYETATRKAWLALIPYINDKGDVMEVCVGTNKLNDKQYYYDRPRIVGDYHGQAPYLWCAYALIEEIE